MEKVIKIYDENDSAPERPDIPASDPSPSTEQFPTEIN